MAMSNNLRLAPFIICNRYVHEKYEDKEYQIHMRKIQAIQARRSRINTVEPVKLPHLAYNAKRAAKEAERQHEIDYTQRITQDHMNKIKSTKGKIDNWNPLYDQKKLAIKENRQASRSKQFNEIERQNKHLKNRIKNVQGHFDMRRLEKDYRHHQSLLGIMQNQYYTPRGMGHRKAISLPEVRYVEPKKKNPLKMLNEAVNQLERGDIVLMKTLANLNYYERMETKRKYEEAYDTDLKKGLIKVMDKQYEPLIQALLTDMNENDVDRIYESLYNPNDACTVITEAFITRNLEQKASLLLAFHQKIDSELKTEIASKLDGDPRTFLLAFLQNNELDNDMSDENRAYSTAKELKKSDSLTSEPFLEVISTESRRQMRQIFLAYETSTGHEFAKKVDQNTPTYKALKIILSYLENSSAYQAEKLQKNLKTNKTEFLRLLSIYPQDELDDIVYSYDRIYHTDIEKDIKANFSPDVTKLILRILHKTPPERPFEEGEEEEEGEAEHQGEEEAD